MTVLSDEELKQEIVDWPDRLGELLGQCHWLQDVTILTKTESTQDALLRLGAAPGMVVVAGRQTGGRGQRGNKWADDLGCGIALSVAVESEESSFLCARAAVSLADAYVSIMGERGIQAGLKWPNDLIAIMDRPRKLAGVLVEDHDRHAIIGLGVNVRKRTWPEELRHSAGTLEDAGIQMTRLDGIVRLLRSFDKAMEMSKEQLREAFSRADLLRGEQVVFEESGVMHEGIVRAVDPFEGVLLDTSDGEVCLRAQLARLHSWGSYRNHGGERGVHEPM